MENISTQEKKEGRFDREVSLIGQDNLDILKRKKVAVFGVGGVGGYVAEMLARAGVGNVDIIDKDVVSMSNINRQIIALSSTLGQSKVKIMKERMEDINPDIKVNAYEIFYLPETKDEIDISRYDYIVDAIDTVTAKLLLIEEAKKHGIKIISAMGAGNKLDPNAFMVSDIYKTSVCPLAKVMRRELKKRNIHSLKVVYSKEEPYKKERTPASISFVPPAMGIIIASEVIKDLLEL